MLATVDLMPVTNQIREGRVGGSDWMTRLAPSPLLFLCVLLSHLCPQPWFNLEGPGTIHISRSDRKQGPWCTMKSCRHFDSSFNDGT